MCGILGILSNKPVSKRILESLKLLEYRGYDSAGIATIDNGKIVKRRAEGKLVKLEKEIKTHPINGNIGIGHTRWATHGLPNEKNAHPHATSKVAVVHNGIIENYRELRQELEKAGYKFLSDTDTEVIPQLITYYLDKNNSPEQASIKTMGRLKGSFAIAAIFSGNDKLMIGMRLGSPLAIGYAKGEVLLGSDAIALSPWVTKISYMEDGDMVVINDNKVKILDEKKSEIQRPIKTLLSEKMNVGKEGYKHYMLKEIHEQVKVVAETLTYYWNPVDYELNMPEFNFDISKIKRITIVACGTSYYAGLVARYWIEKIVGIPVHVDIASEFRYRNARMEEGAVAMFISQSGETADTLAALRYAKQNKQHVISIVNVPESTIARESDVVLRTYAGPEIGVASTKAFTNQLIVLGCFTIFLAKKMNSISEDAARKLLFSLSAIPGKISDILKDKEIFKNIAGILKKATDIIYIGRGTSYAIALEGALKLKEISYIHAEANAAGELKHGSIALIDKKVPVIVIAPSDDLFEKTISNAQEVAARKGQIVAITDKKGAKEFKNIASQTIIMPDSTFLTAPIIYSLPVQLLAYYVALLKKTDIDQPRNLAKSVTVE